MERDLIDIEDQTIEVISDGKMTWVNSSTQLLGRFGKAGYEFHLEDGSWICVWNGNNYNISAWKEFVKYFYRHHSLKIDIKHLPTQIFLEKNYDKN